MSEADQQHSDLIVEADGGSRGNPGPAAFGALVKDAATNRVIVELAGYLGETTNNVAEYSGVIAGLEAAAAINPEARVLARLDSRLVVEQLSGRWAIRNATLRPLALRAKALAPPSRVQVEWVPRSQNKRADALVNECLDGVAAGRPGEIRRWLAADSADVLADAAEQTGVAARHEGAAVEQPGERPATESVGRATTSARNGAAAVRAAVSGDLAAVPGSGALTAPPGSAREQPTSGGAASGGAALGGTALGGTALGGTVPNRIVGWADMDEPTKLLVVRHGVTSHSVEHRFSGRGGIDPPLIPLGVEQADAVAAELAQRGGADCIVTSPLIRARQTAGIIAKRLGLSRPVVVDGLAEAHFGAWEGRTFAEVKAAWPEHLTAWLASPDVAPPEGESFAEVRVRVDRVRMELVKSYSGRKVVVVCHTSPAKAMVQRVLEAPAASAFRIELAPCSLTTIGWWGDGGATIYSVGEVGHLRETLHPTA